MIPKKLTALAAAACLTLSLVPAVSAAADSGEAHTIVLSSTENADGSYTHAATVDGAAVEEFDYAWHADPSEAHDEVKNAPAEYHTGTEPDTDAAVYIAHDVYYYPALDESGFTKVNYDGDQEWAYYYTDGVNNDYIFATLPVQGSGVPTDMMHTEAEAWENAVLHITAAGTYILEGEWHGQIWIDLGDTDDTFADESARVTVILNGVDVTCTVAPALVFYSVYECDNTWEDRDSYTAAADTSGAGAGVIIADGTVNSFTGTNVYRMLKTKYKDETSTAAVKTQKKQRKLDGAFYSYVSMNIDGQEQGTGVLNIAAGYEGLDSELHLTINGGNVNITSQDDGINVNEDGVSVVTVNGGCLHILAGLGSEGDGIDSNGFVVVNGGVVITLANPRSDSGLDSDCGSYVTGGTVVALGSTMDWAESEEDGVSGDQAVMNLQFSSSQSADEAIIVTDTQGKVIFAYDPDKDEVAGDNARWYTGAVVSAPGIEVGGAYYVYVGGDVYGTETEGVYDAATVTGFTDAAKQQCWTSTGDLGGRGGPGGMGERPEGAERMNEDFEGGQTGRGPEDMGEPPEGFDPDQTGGGQWGRRPEDRNDGERPGDMGEMPEGFDEARNGGPGGFGAETAGSEDGILEFTMSKRVNGFQGVTDYTGEASDTETAQETGGFTDVKEGDWFYDSVTYAAENGLMVGVGNGRFNPSGATTRGMIMTILARLDGADTSGGGTWYEKGVAWAVENGVSDGARPTEAITREELAAMLYRYAQYKGDGFTGAWMFLLDYTDAAEISGWADEAVHWCAMRQILSGYPDGTVRPAGGATRAEAASMLARFCRSLEA